MQLICGSFRGLYLILNAKLELRWGSIRLMQQRRKMDKLPGEWIYERGLVRLAQSTDEPFKKSFSLLTHQYDIRACDLARLLLCVNS